MSNAPRAVITRIAILLLITCTASFAWETARNAGAQHVIGTVVHVRPVLAGRGGDNEEFTIRYRWHGQTHALVTRRGILDALGALRGLKTGDSVGLAVRPDAPDRAVLDTLSGRYGITLSFAVLSAVFAVAMTIMAFAGRLTSSDEN